MSKLTDFVFLIGSSTNLLRSVKKDIPIVIDWLVLNDSLSLLSLLLAVAGAEGVLGLRLRLRRGLRALELRVLVLIALSILLVLLYGLLLGGSSLTLRRSGRCALPFILSLDLRLRRGLLWCSGRRLVASGWRRWWSITLVEGDLESGVALGASTLGAAARVRDDLPVNGLQELSARWCSM